MRRLSRGKLAALGAADVVTERLSPAVLDEVLEQKVRVGDLATVEFRAIPPVFRAEGGFDLSEEVFF